MHQSSKSSHEYVFEPSFSTAVASFQDGMMGWLLFKNLAVIVRDDYMASG
jgi:hypothetical protein